MSLHLKECSAHRQVDSLDRFQKELYHCYLNGLCHLEISNILLPQGLIFDVVESFATQSVSFRHSICITGSLLEMQALRSHPRLTESETSFLKESKNSECSLHFRSTALDLGKKFIISYYPLISDHTARHGSKTLTLEAWDQHCN